MEIVNTTPYQESCTMSTDKDGQDHLLAILKATFNIPKRGEISKLSAEQLPIIAEDIFGGDPEASSVLFESDFSLKKPNCDVLLNGCCYAPNEEPATQVSVGIKIGKVQKIINVNGDRVWQHLPTKIKMSEPQTFLKKVISYDVAYGGKDYFDPDKDKHTAYLHNVVGVGYHKILSMECVENTPVPNTEEVKHPVKHPYEDYRPMAFGPRSRACPSRAKLAGSYDKDWVDNQFPFLPKDFDDHYYQAAPEDQQTEYLKGGESIQLVNLTQEGRTQFKVPTMKQKKVVFYFFNGEYKIADFHVDTLHLLPEEGVFTLTARASIPLYGDPFDCSKVIIGRGTKAWQNALNHGKRYIPSIQELKEYKKNQQQEEADVSATD